VIRHPVVTAITPISLDHQAFLGDTLAAIAGEKAGILKPDVPAVIGPQRRRPKGYRNPRLQFGAPLSRWQREWRCEATDKGSACRRALAARSAAAVASRRASDRKFRSRGSLPGAIAGLPPFA